MSSKTTSKLRDLIDKQFESNTKHAISTGNHRSNTLTNWNNALSISGLGYAVIYLKTITIYPYIIILCFFLSLVASIVYTYLECQRFYEIRLRYEEKYNLLLNQIITEHEYQRQVSNEDKDKKFVKWINNLSILGYSLLLAGAILIWCNLIHIKNQDLKATHKVHIIIDTNKYQ
jgi:hypothetical protein